MAATIVEADSMTLSVLKCDWPGKRARDEHRHGRQGHTGAQTCAPHSALPGEICVLRFTRVTTPGSPCFTFSVRASPEARQPRGQISAVRYWISSTPYLARRELASAQAHPARSGHHCLSTQRLLCAPCRALRAARRAACRVQVSGAARRAAAPQVMRRCSIIYYHT